MKNFLPSLAIVSIIGLAIAISSFDSLANWCASSKIIVDTLTNFSGEYIYSTFLSPAQVGAASAAIDIIRQSEDKRNTLRALAKTFRRLLTESGWKTNDFDSPIVPIVVGDAGETLKLRNHLLEHGLLVGAVRPPTVPCGTSRLRVSLHVDVTEAELTELLGILSQWKTS